MAIGFNNYVSQAAGYVNAENNKYKASKERTTDAVRDIKTTKSGSDFQAGAIYEKSTDALAQEKTSKTSSGLGKTIGTPELSKKAQQYYNQLKTKYGNMDFILVSSDMKETAKAQAGSYANPNRMVVLIDEEKIERMASDEKFRSQYEGLIAMAQNNMPKLKDSFGNSSNVKSYGMQVNDNGTASYFAVVKKLSDGQAERIKKKAETKKAEKKEAEKKAEKKAKEEAIEKKLTEANEKADFEEITESEEIKDLFGYSEDDGYEIISASSVEELMKKVSEYTGESFTSGKTGVSFDFRA